jgi:hypothetical protein
LSIPFVEGQSAVTIECQMPKLAKTFGGELSVCL